MKLEPGIYPGLSMAEYLSIEAVSSGVIATLDERCPAAAWYESYLNPDRELDAGSDETRIGTVAHSIALEGTTEGVVVIDPEDYPGQRGGVPVGWTNNAIRAARDAAIAAGKTPILKGDFTAVKAMVDALALYIESLRSTEPAIYALLQKDGGDSELTMVWDDPTGVRCRLRADRISKDRKLVVNLKTTARNAEPGAFGRTLPSNGYHVNAAFYTRGIDEICNVRAKHFWLVQEQQAPHLCSLVGLDLPYVDLAERKVQSGLETFASCLRRGTWPGYPNRVAYVELPPWEAARHEEREFAREGHEYRPEQLHEIRDREQAARVVGSLPDYR